MREIKKGARVDGRNAQIKVIMPQMRKFRGIIAIARFNSFSRKKCLHVLVVMEKAPKEKDMHVNSNVLMSPNLRGFSILIHANIICAHN